MEDGPSKSTLTTKEGQRKPIKGKTKILQCLTNIFRSKTFQILFVISASVPYYSDVISDVMLAMRYYIEGYKWWARLTTTFIAVPYIMTFLISLFLAGGRRAWCYYSCTELHPELPVASLFCLTKIQSETKQNRERPLH